MGSTQASLDFKPRRRGGRRNRPLKAWLRPTTVREDRARGLAYERCGATGEEFVYLEGEVVDPDTAPEYVRRWVEGVR